MTSAPQVAGEGVVLTKTTIVRLTLQQVANIVAEKLGLPNATAEWDDFACRLILTSEEEL